MTDKKPTAELIALQSDIQRIRMEYGTYVASVDSIRGASILGNICDLALKAHEQQDRLAELEAALGEVKRIADMDEHDVEKIWQIKQALQPKGEGKS